MTGIQKQRIKEFRERGYGYTQIAKLMRISVECIKAYCKRHGLGGIAAYVEPDDGSRCEQCGVVVFQTPGRKHKRFCSDKCRMLWWNSHPEQVKRKANYSFICARCRQAFISYGNKSRKYCCHECYIEDRFGGE